MKRLLALFLLPVFSISAAEMVWNTAETFKQWKVNRHVKYEVTGNTARMSNIGVDSSIIIRKLDIDPANYNTFSYKYRASGISGKGGQLYFAGPDGKLADRCFWRIPAMKGDGEWHTVVIPARGINDQKLWYGFKKIGTLRFDPTDGTGGEIEIAEIKLSYVPGNGGVPQQAASPAAVWNKDNKFKGWRPRSNLKCVNTGESLDLTLEYPDSQLRIDRLKLDPKDYDTFVYTYRAEGTGSREGQLFFATDGGNIGNSNFWRLPPLIADGKIHRVAVPASRMPDRRKWYGAKEITTLRFDPTDSAGGTLQIFEIRLEKRSAGATGKSETAADTAAVWNKDNKFKGWRPRSNLKCVNTGEALELTLEHRDSQLRLDRIKLDPKKYNTFTYTYCAEGTGPRDGQLFFAFEGGKIGDSDFWRLPVLIADGKIHKVEVPATMMVDPGRWFGAERITSLRFDPTDSAGGKLKIFDIRFENRPEVDEALKRTWYSVKHPQKLDAPAWDPVKAKFDKTNIVAPAESFFDASCYFKGWMIYEKHDLSPEQGQEYARKQWKTPYRDFFLRKEFELKDVPELGKLQIISDDQATVYINGQRAGEVRSWSETALMDVKKLLRPGKNILAIHYVNGFMAGGVLAELFVSFSDRTFVRINTDETFTGTVEPPENWTQLEADTTKFQPVVTLPPPPAAPWKRRVRYIDFSVAQKLCDVRFVPQKVMAGDDIKLEIEFEGAVPKLPMAGEVLLKRGKRNAWQEKIVISGDARPKGDGRWVLSTVYNMPEYISGGKFDLELKCDALYIVDDRKLQQQIELVPRPAPRGFEKKPVCVVKNGASGAHFELNGKPFFMLAGRYHTFTNPNPPTNTVVLLPSWNKWWQDDGTLNFEEFDRHAETARRNEGNNYFIFDLITYIPDVFLASHPGDICTDDRGEAVRNERSTYRVCHSYASKIALQEMRKAILAAVDYLEKSPYANRIIGYRISGGYTIEWLAWHPAPGRCLDFSPAAKAGFRDFARKNYPGLENPEIPTLAEREKLDNGEIIRDPVKYRSTAAYTEYYSNLCADYVIDLCGAVREKLKGRKLVGSYYGYTMTLNDSGKSQMRGHYALKKLLESRTVDFLMSPQPYSVRNFGDTYGDMKPFATMKSHNIVPVHEDDTRTHKGDGNIGYFQAPNVDLCVEIVRRGIGFNLARNMPLFFIPMPGNFEFPEARRDFRIAETIGRHCLEKQVERKAEIALIVSEKSIVYSPHGHPLISTGEIRQQYNSCGGIDAIRNERKPAFANDVFSRNYTLWGRLGAPADYLLAEDILKNPGDYKMYVFINPVFTDKNLMAAAEMLRSRKCMILWMYAPGYTAYDGNSVDNMKALTGLDFKKFDRVMLSALTMADDKRVMGTPTVRMSPLFAVTTPGGEVLGRYEDGSVGAAIYRTGMAQSVFCGVWRPDLKFLRDLADRAGVKVYSDTGDPLEANEALISLHARSGGRKKLKLFRKTDVLDVFNKKIVARNADEFSFDVKLHDSPLFYYGDDADEVLKKLVE